MDKTGLIRCGNADCAVQTDLYCVQHPRKDGYIVYCADCDYVSPVKDTQEAAVAAWNSGQREWANFDRSELVDRDTWVSAESLWDTPFPDCASRCGAVRVLGVGECDYICPHKAEEGGS